ncbi:WXG100 family type VII secretion target [Microbacterium sp. 20-116]|uniref:WXG100 family type VII secretion target n=1 Tax=Microbacterium sp. 20-116 TaxID=3239883 RepID=UPI0034E20187
MSLIAAPTYESGLSGEAVLGALPVAGGIADSVRDFGSGNITSGVIDAAGSALDVVSLIANPIATLASSCASFLLDYMSPLHEELELLTGSPEMVRALGETWDNVGDALTAVADDRDQALGNLRESWQGAAATGYETVATGLTAILRSLAEAAHSNANGLRLAASVVQIVYEIVKGIIADLVGQLIQAVVEALATVGVGLPVIIAQCSTKIATRVPQVARWVEKIQEVMQKIQKIVEQFTQFGKRFTLDAGEVSGALGKAQVEIDFRAFDLVNAIKGTNSAVGAVHDENASAGGGR